MVLAMTRPTKRRDCGTLQFERRTPRSLLRAGKTGERIPFRFPDPAGDIQGSARIGGVVVKVSLRTHDPYVAKLRCAILNEAIDRYMRAITDGPRRLTNKEIVALAGSWYRKLVRTLEDDPGGFDAALGASLAALSGQPIPRDDADVWRLIAHCIEGQDDVSLAELRSLFGAQAEQILAEHSLIIDRGSRDRLLPAIREAERLAAALLAKRAEGDYSPDPNAVRFPVLPDSSQNANLTCLIEAWKAEAAAVGTAESTSGLVGNGLAEGSSRRALVGLTRPALEATLGTLGSAHRGGSALPSSRATTPSLGCRSCPPFAPA
jgi:hypothetical protein